MINFFSELIGQPGGPAMTVFGAMAIAIACGLALGFVLTKAQDSKAKTEA